MYFHLGYYIQQSIVEFYGKWFLTFALWPSENWTLCCCKGIKACNHWDLGMPQVITIHHAHHMLKENRNIRPAVLILLWAKDWIRWLPEVLSNLDYSLFHDSVISLHEFGSGFLWFFFFINYLSFKLPQYLNAITYATWLGFMKSKQKTQNKQTKGAQPSVYFKSAVWTFNWTPALWALYCIMSKNEVGYTVHINVVGIDCYEES